MSSSASSSTSASTPARAVGSMRPGGNMRLVDALGYSLPPAGVVSILHRVSGLVMFVLLPFVIWLFDVSVSSEASYGQFAAIFTAGALHVPGVVYKLVALVLIWALLHHLIAGVRHLWMDATHDVSKQFGRQSAIATLALAVLLTLALGAKLFFF